MSKYQPKGFRFELDRGVGVITLDRPQRLNALTFEIYQELSDFFATLDRDTDVRAITIRGEGRAFCSGGDVNDIIGELFKRDMKGLVEFTRVTGSLIANIRRVRRPVVGAIHGVAVGAGAVIAAACDIRFFAEGARIGFIFPQVGLSGADMGATYLLPRIVGLGRASELLFTGEIIDANEAYRVGLANRIVPQEKLHAEALAFAHKLSAGPAFAHSVTKQMLESEAQMSLAVAIEAEAQAQAICMAHPDFKTAYDANIAKRAPVFEGAPQGAKS
jgi:enoyl-CoA hydratase/carnithine racemase